MKKYFLFLLLIVGLFGCNSVTELPLSEKMKPADKFARNFIEKIINRQLDSAFANIDPEVLDENAKENITKTSQNINGATLKKYRIVEEQWKVGISSNNGKTANYKLGYEYEFNKGNILFITTVKEKDGAFFITSFTGEFLAAPLAELTKFTLTGKSILHYLFLAFLVLVPLFILTTLVLMFFSKMTIKKKIIWALIILLVSLPRFLINWNTGQMDYNILNISLFGSSFFRPTLYAAWILTFNIPIGAILFWIKRKSLLTIKTDIVVENQATEDRIETNDTASTEK